MLAFAMILSLATVFSTNAYAQDSSQDKDYLLTHHVINYTGLLQNEVAPNDDQILNRALCKFEARTGIKIFVVIVKSLGDVDIETYTKAVEEELGIVKNGNNKYIVFFVAMKDEAVHIDVAPGLNKILPEKYVDKILNEEGDVVPYFKAKMMSEGIISGVTAIVNIVGHNHRLQSLKQDR